ncbi:Nif3-like dinuclear metal center hexameric protein [Schaalia suimastitidis]|uniref:Nif3-like dinuclear metal center hexameric protein n=1 Tax=Schaalia suimastitidis TaxID=121163 RepID=UPI0003FAE28E|nr:Nif3-like dinuclear metal center hexameric protein [Schaalia suimastitidis]
MTKQWTLADVIGRIEAWYPRHSAEEWDRVGLILGDPQRHISRILLAVDPVSATVGQCVDGNFDLLLTHHPLYLRGTSFLPENDPKGKMVADLIRANAALYCAHTNADVAHDGVADALARLVGLTECQPLVPHGVDAHGYTIGLGRIGTIATTTLADFANRVAAVLPAGPHGLYVAGDEATPVTRIAVSGGAGDHFLAQARQMGADVFLTADLRHHPASEHIEGGGPALLCASHWATEWPWLPLLADKLRDSAEADNVSLGVEVSTIVTEPWTSHRPTTGGLR